MHIPSGGLVRRSLYGLLVLLGISLGLMVLRHLPRPPLAAGIPCSLAIYARDGQLLRLTLAADEQYRVWLPLKRVDPKVIQAVMLYEDRWFRWHPGVNPVALARAALATLGGGKRQGASTLTMQLVRRLYNIDSRTIAGKLHQIGTALWIEARYGKDEILEAYLNLAPFGGNVEGIEAASLIYFHKPAVRLNLPEALALAVIPQNPNKRLATLGGKGIAPALEDARGRLWQTWLGEHPEDARLAADMNLPLTPYPISSLPFAAPHFTDTLVREDWQIGSPGGELATSLDPAAQVTLERVVHSFVEHQRMLGIRNASALLVHAPTMEVRALVGSADFFSSEIDGQVNGMAAKRSPGSTLKPFIYGLALDQGFIHPRTVLRDAPTAFGPFSPENFDGRFVGPITAQEALVRSRNIPAVGLAARLSKPSLYDFLKMAGVGRMASESHYGLALTLGGGEVTGEELARMYALLANGGVLGDVHTRPAGQGAGQNGPRLLSQDASFMVLDMLRHNRRPDSGLPAAPPVAWKTGTSWGFRDAWTAGVFGSYVLVVWVGNFDSTSNQALVGVQTAAPLFFRIVDSLRAQNLKGSLDPVKPAPAGVSLVEVCAASGDLPNAWCRDRAFTWFIPGKSPIRVSTLHRPLYIDQKTGQAVCAPGPGVKQEIFEYWSSDMLRLFKDAGMPRREPPPAPECSSGNVQNADGLHITSPLRATTYTQRLSKPVPIALRADRSSGSGKLYWFVDGAFIGTAEGSAALGWTPERTARYTVRVVDETGQADSRDVNVEFVP